MRSHLKLNEYIKTGRKKSHTYNIEEGVENYKEKESNKRKRMTRADIC